MIDPTVPLPIVKSPQEQLNSNSRRGFASHPENINMNGAPKSEEKKAREKFKQIIEKELVKVVTLQDGEITTKQIVMIRSMINRAIKKDNMAASILMDRVDGRPTQTNELSGNVEIIVKRFQTETT